MDRVEIRKRFGTSGPVVLPVIHVLDEVQARKNVSAALAGGAHGVFLINHDFPKEQLFPILDAMRGEFPKAWIGVNFLAVTGLYAFPILGELERRGTRLDAYWADNARIDEHRPENDQPEATAIGGARSTSGWKGLYFGGSAFKGQREVSPEHHEKVAWIAARHMDVVTTSGTKTGIAADLSKIKTFRRILENRALAVASGITPENATDYTPLVDAFLVATGINHKGDFYNIDPVRLKALLEICNESALPAQEAT